jgi:phosphopantetheine--protein transferase-like protein
MTIRGIGIDLVHIARMREAVTNNAQFTANTFTDAECTYCNSYADAASHYAGTFAAKEAVRKATGDISQSFRDVEIIRTPQGKPEVWAGGAPKIGIHISITHTDDIAQAIAIYET